MFFFSARGNVFVSLIVKRSMFDFKNFELSFDYQVRSTREFCNSCRFFQKLSYLKIYLQWAVVGRFKIFEYFGFLNRYRLVRASSHSQPISTLYWIICVLLAKTWIKKLCIIKHNSGGNFRDVVSFFSFFLFAVFNVYV